jgi:hypothetical protein
VTVENKKGATEAFTIVGVDKLDLDPGTAPMEQWRHLKDTEVAEAPLSAESLEYRTAITISCRLKLQNRSWR